MLRNNLCSIIGPAADQADGAGDFNTRDCGASGVKHQGGADGVGMAFDRIGEGVEG